MGLENVRKGLLQEAQGESRRMLAQAQGLTSQINEGAGQKARKIKSEAKNRARRLADAEGNERTSAAQLKARKMVSEAVNMKMDEALQKVWHEFAVWAQGKEYEKMLKELITGAEKELGGKCILQVNPRDIKAAEKFSKNVAKKAEDISGGAILSTLDGRISIDNSLESIFAQRKDEAKKVLFSELFGHKGQVDA